MAIYFDSSKLSVYESSSDVIFSYESMNYIILSYLEINGQFAL